MNFRRIFVMYISLLMLFFLISMTGSDFLEAKGNIIDEPSNEIPADLKPIKNRPDGWGGLRWKDAPEKLGQDRIVIYKSEDGHATSYKKAREELTLGDIALDSIIYAFYNDQLAIVYIKCVSSADFNKVRDFALAKYGEPNLLGLSDDPPGWLVWTDDFVVISLIDLDQPVLKIEYNAMVDKMIGLR
jgi:hypothetical protein